jgi:hypothetical protein
VDNLEQTALLHTVDRVLVERGQDPDIITEGDKFSIAAQCVQLCALQQHLLKKAVERLAEALGADPGLPLEELVVDVAIIVKERRMPRERGMDH